MCKIYSLLRDNCQGVLIQTPCITIEQDLHTQLYRFNSLLFGDIRHRSFVRGDFAEDGDGEVSTVPGSEGWGGKASSKKVGGGKEAVYELVLCKRER